MAWGRSTPKRVTKPRVRGPRSGAVHLACGYATCQCDAIAKRDGGVRPCPQHPGYLLRGSATRCAHPDC